jgi:hypothetical protein
MSAPNGHANGAYAPESPALLSLMPPEPEAFTQPQDATNQLFEALQVPFDPSLVKWRVNETKKIHGRLHGFALAYADMRAYQDRLNAVVTPAGWSNQNMVAATAPKIVVKCELHVLSLGLRSAMGEEWSRDPNAATSAEAQAFKRACSGFGVGRYLYSLEGIWLEIDNEKRPRNPPALPAWATPDGWKQGLRPAPGVHLSIEEAATQNSDEPIAAASDSAVGHNGKNVIRAIHRMEEELGRPLYRGLLKSIARAWRPEDIKKVTQQKQVLEHMEAAERGLARASQAVAKLDRPAVIEILRSLDVDSIHKVTDLKTLHKVVVALEQAAEIQQSA